MSRQNPLSKTSLPRATLALSRLLYISSWLQLFGALLAFVLISFFTATQSELANYISPGESPFFQWIRGHITELLWSGLAYLVLTAGLQYLAIRFSRDDSLRGMMALVGAELVAVGLLAYALLSQRNGLLAWGHTLLQASILLQVTVTLRRFMPVALDESIQLLDLGDRSRVLFLSLLFVLAAVPAALDPSWHRMQEYVQLDSNFEIALSHVLPAVLSGVTGLWFGIGALVILDGLGVLWGRLDGHERRRQWFACVPFLFISGFYAAILLASLAYGIEWELSSLQLRSTLLPLFIFLCGGGGVLSYVAFRRLAPHALRAGPQSLVGMMALSMGAVLVFPITWLLTRPGSGRWSWRFLLATSLLGSLFLGSYIVYGNLFNPWFTVFSYLKGAVVKITAVIAAGIMVLIFQELRSSELRHSPQARRRWIAVAFIVPLGFLPFASLERYPETKAAILQFNESSMVDATYARALSDLMGLEGWVRLGQGPKPHPRSEPWPLPWTLEKTRPSFLPKDFNLVVIVVDALRGDAFYSAGYHRNLTPFLDTWAHEEGISFRRAYSQGGGTFAAFPFLVAGRSHFDLYGPHLHQENLYFKIAQAEGIDTMMVIKEFGPRAIFPPDFPVIELGGSGAYSDRRSVPADEVFGWAQDAIAKLAERERFLAFLHLMDVHNDLWKKADGLDFGDTPRDLYDNNLSYIDRAFGRFVGWLKQQGIYDRTVILLTSDHGEQFWEHGASLHGHTVYEEEIRIPMILVAHGIRGRVEDVPVLAADMAPTVAELAGYTVHPPYDDPRMGISLVPLVLGKERVRYLNRDILGRASFKQRYFLYRNWKWKLVYSADFDLLQLFDTARDPGERKNLLQEKRELAAELERELLGYLERVGGKSYRPLLHDTSS
ncbi:MAG: sulfatase [Candidatus Methylomirabilales bacterium]